MAKASGINIKSNPETHQIMKCILIFRKKHAIEYFDILEALMMLFSNNCPTRNQYEMPVCQCGHCRDVIYGKVSIETKCSRTLNESRYWIILYNGKVWKKLS